MAGLDVVRDAHAVRRKIGYMPAFFGVYDDLTEKHDAPVDGLARGMKQRLGLARSASKKHAVILNGVSPRAQAGAKRSEEPSPRDAYGTAGQSLTEMGGGGGRT